MEVPGTRPHVPADVQLAGDGGTARVRLARPLDKKRTRDSRLCSCELLSIGSKGDERMKKRGHNAKMGQAVTRGVHYIVYFYLRISVRLVSVCCFSRPNSLIC